MTALSVYCAGSSDPACLPRIYWAMVELERAGIRVVSTWPQNVASVGAANPRDASSDQREDWMRECLRQIESADVLWFVVPSPQTTRGAWIELGYAYALGKTIVSSGDTLQSIGCALGHEFGTDAGALGFLVKYAGSRARRDAPPVDVDLVAIDDGPTPLEPEKHA